MGYYEHLLQDMDGMPVANTHSHYLEPSQLRPCDLDAVLAHSYVAWRLQPPGKSRRERAAFLERMRCNSYFFWLEKALQALHGLEGPLTAENWDELSRRIEAAHADMGRSIGILKETCGYAKVIHDPYWEPQQANPHPGFFTPAYHINMFAYGWGSEAREHDGHNAQIDLGTDIRDIDEYVETMKLAVKRKKAEGCVALKSALAYDRGIDFRETPKEKAQAALTAGNGASAGEARDFQDFIFFEICRIAAELNMPFQNHTGLGQLHRTNAMQLHEAIGRNPETRFVLFHGSYPWTDDVGALLHNYGNVYPDICWLPLISPAACERLLSELLDVGMTDRLCWGCDTWTAEESYGALLAARHVIARTLAAKVEEGRLSLRDAEKLAKNILHDNATGLYGL